MTPEDQSSARRPLAALEREARCRSCGKTFTGVGGEVYCSDECEEHQNAPRIGRSDTDRRAAADPAALGIFGTPDPDQLEWICQRCASTFTSGRGTPTCDTCRGVA